MRTGLASLLAGLVLAAIPAAFAQSAGMEAPPNITAGASFSIPTTGSGPAVLYIVGPAQALRRTIALGQPVSFPAGVLYNAGRYVAILTAGSATDTALLTVVPADKPDTLGFLARPSRLAVGLHNGISGTVYLFDAYHNLIAAPMAVSFDLSTHSGTAQTRSVESREGVAWTEMNSAEKEGAAKFTASAGGVSSTRVIEEVPGDPCRLTISAQPDGNRVRIETAPVRDCAGNPVPDGTVITFTETYGGAQSTVDVPLKQDQARIEMPAHNGARISVASGVVAGNEIRLEGVR